MGGEIRPIAIYDTSLVEEVFGSLFVIQQNEWLPEDIQAYHIT